MKLLAGRYDGGIPNYRGAGPGGRHYARHTVCRIRKTTVYPRTYSLPSSPTRNARQPGLLIGIPGVLAYHVEKHQKRAPGLADGAVQTLLTRVHFPRTESIRSAIAAARLRSPRPGWQGYRAAVLPALGCLRLFSGLYTYLSG